MVQIPASSRSPAELLELRLTNVSFAAESINFYEFRRTDGGALPTFEAGAHVDLHLPNGLVRQYSLSNPQSDRDRYVLGVKRDVNSRGGSRYIHDQLKVGTILRVSRPRNNFQLVESGAPVVFVAGGIGVTPLYCMLDRAKSIGLDWRFYYSSRRRAEAALLHELQGYGRNVSIHVDEETGGNLIAMSEIIGRAKPDAHLYCCGPAPMLDAFEASAREFGFPDDQIHVERFAAEPFARSTESFVVELAATGKTIVVGPGQTILEAARDAGAPVEASCEQGVCGACETKVLAGLPDHKDMILSKAERASNRTMMICCSGSLSERLVLDL